MGYRLFSLWKISAFLFLFSANSHAAECISQRLVQIDSPKESLQLIISNSGDKVVYHLSSHESLEVLNPSGSTRLINRNNGSILQRALTAHEREVVALIQNNSFGNISDLVKKCKDVPEHLSHQERMSTPLSPFELLECKELIQKNKAIQECLEGRGCQETYDKYYSNGKPKKEKRFSFKQLLESGQGMISSKAAAVAAGYGLGAAVDLINVRLLFKYGGRIVATAGKVGLATAGTAAVVVSYAIPWGFALFVGNDQCKESELFGNQDQLNNCLQSSNKVLDKRFSDTINQALQKPDDFLKNISNPKNGLGARLACSLLEDISDQWDLHQSKISCQGRTLNFGNDPSYLIAKDGHLYRHKDMSYTYHFGLNGKPIAIEKRYEGAPDLVLTQKNTNESELLKSLSPRINEVLKTCSVPQNQPFSIEESQDTNY